MFGYRRVTFMTVGLAAAALVVTLGRPGIAYGHVPVLEPYAPSEASRIGSEVSGVRETPPPQESRALYGTLAPDERLDAYAFEVESDVGSTLELLVPASLDAGFTPALRLIDTTDGSTSVATETPAETFFEPFSLQRFRVVRRLPFDLAAGHRYVVTVEPETPPGRPMPYVIGFSGAERFSAGETLASIVYVPRIWFGLYGQWAPRWGMISGAAVLLALAVALVWRWLTRRRGRRRAAEVTGPRAPAQ